MAPKKGGTDNFCGCFLNEQLVLYSPKNNKNKVPLREKFKTANKTYLKRK